MTKLVYFISFIFLNSCVQTFNSSSTDSSLTAFSRCADQSNTKLCEANDIIYSQCIDCHDRFHDDWANYDTNQKWVDSARVIAGDADRSPLIIKLKNEGGNMPKDKPTMSEADLLKLKEWINTMP